MNDDTYKKVVWDYNLPKSDFQAILDGKRKVGKFDQAWAVARVLENLNYYDALDLVSVEQIKKNWQNIEPRLFNQSIKDGYGFLLRRYTLSSAR